MPISIRDEHDVCLTSEGPPHPGEEVDGVQLVGPELCGPQVHLAATHPGQVQVTLKLGPGKIVFTPPRLKGAAAVGEVPALDRHFSLPEPVTLARWVARTERRT